MILVMTEKRLRKEDGKKGSIRMRTPTLSAIAKLIKGNRNVTGGIGAFKAKVREQVQKLVSLKPGMRLDAAHVQAIKTAYALTE